jgi:predicted membrane protein
MSKPSATPEPTRAPLSRVAIVLSGVALGVVWGSVMWLIFELTGSESGLRGWAYLAITIGMLGGGVAAFFGATGAQRRGERVGPRIFGRRRRDR